MYTACGLYFNLFKDNFEAFLNLWGTDRNLIAI